MTGRVVVLIVGGFVEMELGAGGEEGGEEGQAGEKEVMLQGTKDLSKSSNAKWQKRQ